MNVSMAPLGFVGKVRVFLACVVAVMLMRMVGWHVAQPVDPEEAITFVTNGRGVWAIWPTLLILSVVTAVIATVIIGRQLPEGGVFAAAVGLAGLALRGGSMQVMLAYHTTLEAVSRRTFMWKMAVDCLLWALIMVIVWLAVVLTTRWLWPKSETQPASDEPRKSDPSKKATASANWQIGWPALVVTIVVAVFVIWMTIARTPVAEIARGQIVASVAGGLFLGAMVARYFTGINDSRWFALAVPAVALIAYLLGYLNAEMGWAQSGEYYFYSFLNTTPPHALMRAMPIEYLSVGTAAVLAGFWSGVKMEHVAEQELL